jgi:hypothetical protein
MEHFAPYEKAVAEETCLPSMGKPVFCALGTNTKNVEERGVLGALSGAACDFAAFGYAVVLFLELS